MEKQIFSENDVKILQNIITTLNETLKKDNRHTKDSPGLIMEARIILNNPYKEEEQLNNCESYIKMHRMRKDGFKMISRMEKEEGCKEFSAICMEALADNEWDLNKAYQALVHEKNEYGKYY